MSGVPPDAARSREQYPSNWYKQSLVQTMRLKINHPVIFVVTHILPNTAFIILNFPIGKQGGNIMDNMIEITNMILIFFIIVVVCVAIDRFIRKKKR